MTLSLVTADAGIGARAALDRTLRLMRDHVSDTATDDELLEALTTTSVLVVADRVNLSSMEGQQALLTTMLLAARSGARVSVRAPNVPVIGLTPPFASERLVDAVLDLGADLIPGVSCVAGSPERAADLAVIIGDTPWSGRAGRAVRLAGGAWGGQLSAGGTGARMVATGSPFGALAAAGLAAGEAYKAALARLRPHARHAGAFDDLFAPTAHARVSLAPEGTPPPACCFGHVDVISGGAIAQSLLYVLARVPDVCGEVRVIEPETSDYSNLNRYLLLRRSRCSTKKVNDLEALDLGGLALTGLALRFGEETLTAVGPLADMVVVGVDHIPTRWLVQRARPGWLGIGATSHYSAMASHHERGTGCAHCLHPYDEPDAGPIPTVAFVSFWAGLWLASLVARHASGERLPTATQSVYMTPLRAESPTATWCAPVPPRHNCPLLCPL